MSANDRQVAGTHYKEMGIEVWDVVDTWPEEQRIGAYRFGMLKYVMRMGNKDERLQEIEKAVHYGEKLCEVLRELRDRESVVNEPLVTFSDVISAMIRLCEAKGTKFGWTVLREFGARDTGELHEFQYKPFVDRANEILEVSV